MTVKDKLMLAITISWCLLSFSVLPQTNTIFFVAGLAGIYFMGALLKNWCHAIMMMMLLEMMMLLVFFAMVNFNLFFTLSTSLFILSTFMVIEASLGMSILTLMVRTHGNDFLLIF